MKLKSRGSLYNKIEKGPSSPKTGTDVSFRAVVYGGGLIDMNVTNSNQVNSSHEST